MPNQKAALPSNLLHRKALMNKVHVHVPYHRIEEYLVFIKQHKLNLEIFFQASFLDTLKPGDIERLMDSLDYKPSFSIHAPFMDLSPAAVDSKVRAVTLERFSQVLDIAGILSSDTLVFHSGYEKWKYALSTDIWLRESVKTWVPLIEKAERLGVRIAIENIFEDEPLSLRLLMDEFKSENFGICFDTGHCNLFSKVPLAQWLESLREYFIEFHLHDNDRSADLHLPIGDGTFDFRTLFSAANRQNCVHTLEAHTPARILKSMERLNEYQSIKVDNRK